MKRTTLLMFFTVIFFTTNLQAKEISPYIALKALYTDIDAEQEIYYMGPEKFDIGDSDFGTAVSLGVSKKLPKGAFRTELEYSKKADIERKEFLTKIETQSFMLNSYLDIDTASKFTPYLSAGIGFSKIKVFDFFYETVLNDTNFTWQIGAGASYKATDKLSIDAGFRYIDFGNLSQSYYAGVITEDVDMTANEFYMGVRFSF